MTPQKIVRILIAGFVLSLAVFSLLPLMIHQSKVYKRPVLGQVANFALIDAQGHPFGSQQLKGKIWVANFFFTTCADVCPMMTKNMAALNRSFAAVKNIALVSITVNPDYDSPGVLAQYAKKYSATKNWYFLTGSVDQIKKIAVGSFKLGSIEEPVFHSTYFSLVDRNGYIRGYYDGTKAEDINRLFKEAAELSQERF